MTDTKIGDIMKNSTIWLEGISYNPSKSLDKNIEVDVLIIGGGITGLSIAYHLKDEKLKACLIERNEIGRGVTARTTGKLTFLQENIYTKLKSEKKAKLYLESQIEAIKMVESIITKNNIQCDYERVSSYLFTEDKKNIKKIKKEKELLEKFGIKIKEIDKLPNRRIVKYGISVDKTAVFHPIKYLIGLKEIIKEKIDIYENTKITDIRETEKCYICKVNRYIIQAKQIVIATHYPYFLFPFMMPFKCHLEKSYIAAFEKDNYHFSAINTNQPTVSIRYYQNHEKSYQLYLNGSHNLAFKNNQNQNFMELLKELKINPDYVWSNKDIITNDFLPYIGKIKENMYIATGYNTWGMTNGTIAGKIISDMIMNKKNKYEKLFDPKRSINVSKIINFSFDIVSNLKSFVGMKLIKNKSWYPNNIQFKKINGKDIAIYIDENKIEHIVYQKCPHMKCNLLFNEIEKTWDCPCHGSRFDIDGNCIEGPSNYNISYQK